MLPNLFLDKNYIDGEWIDSTNYESHPLIHPSTEIKIATIKLSKAEDVNTAIEAASEAFKTYQFTSKVERVAMLDRIIACYEKRYEDMVMAVSCEMGAPLKLSRNMQVAAGLNLFKSTRNTLEAFCFSEQFDGYLQRKEPIGVCAMITPWNWPLNQMVAKVAAALAAGSTMVLKPSEYSPASASLLAEIIDEAEVPKGVFNLIQGGGEAGSTMSAHPLVDMVSITGSTRAGIAVAKAAAPTVKRVTQELGGKSPYVILPNSNLDVAVRSCIRRLLINNGQSCNAPTRLLVHCEQLSAVEKLIPQVIAEYKIGRSFDESVDVGPLVNAKQFERVKSYIKQGVDAGAKLIAGGVGFPEGIKEGYFVQPTVFSNVDSSMAVVRDEIFGPVLSILTYRERQEAIDMANDTEYGLTAYVFCDDVEKAIEFSTALRVGMVHINDTNADLAGPFGGYKMSGNGRERGVAGLEEYLETKAVFV
ncbi:aldehyde dehydrogenase family protein [Alteromonas sp. C1M14]|uniref:aldehyde dehydrogenase family protein n=1 Tax=Alteromonas sp. C1M14 TaxID=2841567 RepID=UPI001C090D04|nr:aldehyde dehydrogenase family protein [Alteromonas sp. C1M14]MBU2978237.1 aldehyde dehydrogenase family protein [Alteromonas sp. C1M14]